MFAGAQYYTLVASLKELAPDVAFDPAARDEILRELSASDRKTVALLDEWNEIAAEEDVAGQREKFEDYYRRTEQQGGPLHPGGEFLREWARFDRDLRTGIARGEWPAEMGKTTDIVERERALDRVRWGKADELQGFDDFGLPTVMAYLVKLGIVGRWTRLSPEAGREMYDKLVNGLRE